MFSSFPRWSFGDPNAFWIGSCAPSGKSCLVLVQHSKCFLYFASGPDVPFPSPPFNLNPQMSSFGKYLVETFLHFFCSSFAIVLHPIVEKVSSLSHSLSHVFLLRIKKISEQQFVRISSHSTVCLKGSPLDQGLRLNQKPTSHTPTHRHPTVRRNPGQPNDEVLLSPISF